MEPTGSLKRKWEGDASTGDGLKIAEFDRAGLSPWDRERPVRPLITDEAHRTTLQIRSLNAELTCPVCLGILRHTMTVMECLHRFCDGCITRALRLGRKECPTCRLKCSTKRNLRADPAIDGLVRRFYSDVEEFEKRQEEQIRSINAALMKQSQGHDVALRRQAAAAAAAARLKETKPASPPAQSAPSASTTSLGGPPPPPPMPAAARKPRANPPAAVKMPVLKAPASEPASSSAAYPTVPYTLASPPPLNPDVALELRPLDSSAAQLSHPFLRVPRAATLGTLAKLLAQRLGASNVDSSVVHFYLPSVNVPLKHKQAVGEIWSESQTDHRLFYALPKQ